MGCYKAGCVNPVVAGSDRWGFVADTVCEQHAEEIKGKLTEKGPITRSYLDDYVRIKVLMDEKTTVMQCLTELGSELGKLRDLPNPSNNGEGYIKLSAALARYEGYCCFPPTHELFIGFVPPDSFMGYIARGLMPKDPGAGLEHGDFTHRLHWHVISRVVTGRFMRPKIPGWNHTPLELYTSLGHGEALAANTWFNLIDDNAASTFTSPDKFHQHVRDGNYGVLSLNVTRRYTKRKEEFNAHFDEEEFERIKSTDFTWKQIPGGGDRKYPAHQIYRMGASARAGEAYATRKVESEKFNAVEDLPILQSNAAPDPLTLEQRIAHSRSSLNQTQQQNREHTVYSRDLGMVTRRLGSRSTALPRYPK